MAYVFTLLAKEGIMKFWLFRLYLALKIKFNRPQNNRDLNQGILHTWSKYGDPSLDGRWVMMQNAQIWVHFDFQVKFDLECQGHSPPEQYKS